MSLLHTVCSPNTSRPPSPLSSPQLMSSPSPLTHPSSPAGSHWVHKCVDTNVSFHRQPRSRTLQDGQHALLQGQHTQHWQHTHSQHCLQHLLWLVCPQMGSLAACLTSTPSALGSNASGSAVAAFLAMPMSLMLAVP